MVPTCRSPPHTPPYIVYQLYKLKKRVTPANNGG